MAISLGGFSGGGGAGAVTSVNGQTGVVVVSGDDVAADHTASNYTAANANVDGHLSGIDTKLGTLAAGLTYKGAFNATAGTPSIANALQGDLYVVDTAGTIYGQTWAIGDHLLINANMGGSITNSKIDKIDNTDQVTSVNGSTGAVTLSGDDLTADHTASNYTAANANIDGHLSGVDSKFGTLGTASTAASTDFLASTAGLDDLSDVSFTAGAGIDNYVLTYDHSSTSWGAEVVPSAPVTSVNGSTGVVVVSGDDVAADHTASNYTAANANVDGHLSGIDSKFGTLGTASTAASTDFLASTAGLDDLSDVSFTAGAGIDNYVLTYDHSSTSWGAEVVPSAPVTSVNSSTGAVVVSGNDVAADHTASNYTAANANVDGHLSGVDTKLGTLGTASTAASTDFLSATGPDTLGGNLDVGTSDIVSSSNNNIEFAANGTGVVKVIPTATGGHLELNGDSTNVGKLRLMCEQSSHGIYLTGPSHAAAASYTLKFPDTAGTNNFVLKTDGSGNLDWVAQSGGSGGGFTYSAISSTTTAQAQYHYSCTGTFTLTLPAASGVTAGEEIRVKNMGTGTITIDRSSTDTIDAQASVTLGVQYQMLSFVSNGSNAYEVI